jgi:hypothetical protein
MELDKPKYINAVESLVGGEVGGYSDGPISEIRLFDGQTPPTEEAIQEKLVELLAEYDAQEYARNRKAEYDALNQFELMSDDAINGTTTHKDAIAAVKTKYPKG